MTWFTSCVKNDIKHDTIFILLLTSDPSKPLTPKVFAQVLGGRGRVLAVQTPARPLSFPGNQTHTIATYPAPIADPQSYLPTGTLRMEYPFKLKTQPCPVNKKNVRQWTEKERKKAERAHRITELHELREYVSIHSSYVISNLVYLLKSDPRNPLQEGIYQT
jgi:hypothetical protein